MKKYICDLCKKEITPSDIRAEVQLNIGNKEETADFHSLCWYRLLKTIREGIQPPKD